jgi:hypothetical protein
MLTNKWISIKEKLPKFKTNVLTICGVHNREIVIGYCEHDRNIENGHVKAEDL